MVLKSRPIRYDHITRYWWSHFVEYKASKASSDVWVWSWHSWRIASCECEFIFSLGTLNVSILLYNWIGKIIAQIYYFSCPLSFGLKNIKKKHFRDISKHSKHFVDMDGSLVNSFGILPTLKRIKVNCSEKNVENKLICIYIFCSIYSSWWQ